MSYWTESMMMMAMGGVSPPDLGEFWEGEGGYYMGNIVDPDDGVGGRTWALVAAPKSEELSLAWKTTNTDSPGTLSLTNGLANSNAMNNSSHPAAFYCRGLTINDHADWYLLADEENTVVYTNSAALPGGETYDDALYWSSTQSGSSVFQAWWRRFVSGNHATGTKNNTYLVRPARRVAI